MSNTANQRDDWPGFRAEAMAGVRALVWKETTGLDQELKVLMALKAGFKQVNQPAKEVEGTLLPGLTGPLRWFLESSVENE